MKRRAFIKAGLLWLPSVALSQQVYLPHGRNAFRPAASGGGSTLLDDLVAHWKLDETSGDRSDSHSGGYTLTDQNTVTYDTGKLGNAASFSAVNTEALYINDNAALDCVDPTPFTISAWVNMADKTANRGFAGKTASTSSGFRIYYRQANDRFRFRINGTEISADNLGSPSTGTWYLVVATFDPATDTATIRVNNGTPNSSSSVTAAIADTTAKWVIGASFNTLSEYMEGLMDSVSYWHRVLTSDEMTALYNSGNGLDYPFS